MAIIKTRTSDDTNLAADINELSEEALDKGGTSQITAISEETSPTADDLYLMERDSDGDLRKVKQSNVEKTIQNNNKQYVAGNTYNAVALTVTGDANWTTNRAVFIPYQTVATSLGEDTAWRLRFNIAGAEDPASDAMTLTITGVVFKNAALYQQSCSVYHGSTRWGTCITVVNTGQLQVNGDGNNNNWKISGDVELESKPSWAD